MADLKSGKKPQKLKARLPRGLADRGPAEIAATREMVEKIRAVFERYGFEPVETPAIEYTDALGKFLPDQDRPNEGVFSFQDDDEQWLSLRYDLTAPLARYVAENFQNIALPYRSYRYGYVYRNEKPGPGRFRQFMQFDADTVGAASMTADAEMCMLAADTMEALGLKRGDYVVKVWNRKLLDGRMNAEPELRDAPTETRLKVLRSIDKLDRLGIRGLQELLGPGRTDPSGDRTPGAGLSIQANNFITIGSSIATVPYIPTDKFIYEIPDFKEQIEKFESGERPRFDIAAYRKEVADYLKAQPFPAELEVGLRELEEISRLVDSTGYSDRLKIDRSVVRGLEYYTGPVFEVELLIETKDDKGRPVRFGSVGGGGRYDGLVSRFRGEPVPATGFSIGVSRLQAALAALGKLGMEKQRGPVVVAVFGADNIESAQKLTTLLRNAPVDPNNPNGPKIRAELYLGNPKHGIGQQLKYADKRNSPCAVIQGPDEIAASKVLVRDLIAGAARSNAADREAHLRAQAQAQVSVAEADLVAAVQKLLSRHKLNE